MKKPSKATILKLMTAGILTASIITAGAVFPAEKDSAEASDDTDNVDTRLAGLRSATDDPYSFESELQGYGKNPMAREHKTYIWPGKYYKKAGHDDYDLFLYP